MGTQYMMYNMYMLYIRYLHTYHILWLISACAYNGKLNGSMHLKGYALIRCIITLTNNWARDTTLGMLVLASSIDRVR